MTRLFAGLLAATALSTSACAETATDPVATDAQVTDSQLTEAQLTDAQMTDVQVEANTAVLDTADTVASVDTGFSAPESAWRTPDADDLLYIDTDYGRMIVELYPEIAPAHVDRIRTLAKTGFYDGLKFHRVIDGFMNQTGDPTGTGTGDSGMADLEPEFTFRRDPAMAMTMVGAMRTKDGNMDVGFLNGLPVASKPSAQAMMTPDNKVEAFGLHCLGVTSMARTAVPASANSQFFLMRGKASHLDSQYSIWGKVIHGLDQVERIKLTEVNGAPVDMTPDVMKTVTLASELPEAERVDVQVLDTNSDAFSDYLDGLKTADGYPEICDIDIPSRVN